MSKKTKRSSRSAPTRPISSTPAVELARVTPSPAAGVRRSEKEFNPDYSDVIKDLKRIGTLAGTFFFVMIILSFFLK